MYTTFSVICRLSLPLFQNFLSRIKSIPSRSTTTPLLSPSTPTGPSVEHPLLRSAESKRSKKERKGREREREREGGRERGRERGRGREGGRERGRERGGGREREREGERK